MLDLKHNLDKNLHHFVVEFVSSLEKIYKASLEQRLRKNWTRNNEVNNKIMVD